MFASAGMAFAAIPALTSCPNMVFTAVVSPDVVFT